MNTVQLPHHQCPKGWITGTLTSWRGPRRGGICSLQHWLVGLTLRAGGGAASGWGGGAAGLTTGAGGAVGGAGSSLLVFRLVFFELGKQTKQLLVCFYSISENSGSILLAYITSYSSKNCILKLLGIYYNFTLETHWNQNHDCHDISFLAMIDMKMHL